MGSAVREWDTRLQRCIRVDHRGRDRVIVVSHSRLERLQIRVYFSRLHEYFSSRAPYHHNSIALVRTFEALDVRHQLFGKLELVCALFDMCAVKTLDVALIEYRLHRLHSLKLRLELIHQVSLEDPRVKRRLIGIFFEYVPGAENEIVDGS